MRYFRFSALMLAMLAVCGCAGAASAQPTASQSQPASSQPAPQTDVVYEQWEQGYLPQFAEPQSGTPIVTLHTSMGDIRIMMFPQAAPKAVESFVTHCKNGYYDGVTFHRVIEGFMIQGGDPLGNGTGGESAWGGDFEDEFSDNLYNFRGALSMANAGYGTNGSQFFIVQEDAAQYPDSPYRVTDENADQFLLSIALNKEIYNGTMLVNERAVQPGMTSEALNAYIDELNAALNEKFLAGVSDEMRAAHGAAIEKYKEVGGTPSLDYKHTVFGQVLEGMDVVDAIARVEKGANDKPVVDVVIESTAVETAP